MRINRLRAIFGLVTVCLWMLTACGNAAGQTTAGGSGQPDGTGTTAQTEIGSGGKADSQGIAGAGQTDVQGAGSGQPGEGDASATSLIPILLNDETNAISIGSYEWGGRIVTDSTVRHDALEARIRAINADRSAEAATEQVYVTRSDETAVSLVVCVKENAENTASFVSCKTYTLNPETGKDLRLTDVVTDTDSFVKALRQSAETTTAGEGSEIPEGEMQQDFLAAYATDAQLLEMAQKNWTLDYDGITVYPPEAFGDGTENIPCVTVRFSEHNAVFQEVFSTHPASYMVQILPGRTYRQHQNDMPVCVVRKEANPDKMPQFPQTIQFGETQINVSEVSEYAMCYFIRMDGHGFVLRDLPRPGNTNLMNSYVLELYDLAQTKESQEPEGVMIRYGLADRGALDPKRLRLFDDSFYERHPLMQSYVIEGYAYYSMTAAGDFERESDFWYLQGPERTTIRPADTLGYRLYDTETLVSKQITRDMSLLPYRTDGKTFFEFVGNGDVFRFEIDSLDEHAKLNGTYTFDMLFGT